MDTLKLDFGRTVDKSFADLLNNPKTILYILHNFTM
jgi:hypothetical protein